jgi:hypothetical protein
MDEPVASKIVAGLSPAPLSGTISLFLWLSETSDWGKETVQGSSADFLRFRHQCSFEFCLLCSGAPVDSSFVLTAERERFGSRLAELGEGLSCGQYPHRFDIVD